MAYQRLFEFVKSKCERLAESNASAAEDIEPTLQAAIRALRKLPTYLHQCLDLVVNSRRSQLVRTAKGLVILSLGIAMDIFLYTDVVIFHIYIWWCTRKPAPIFFYHTL